MDRPGLGLVWLSDASGGSDGVGKPAVQCFHFGSVVVASDLSGRPAKASHPDIDAPSFIFFFPRVGVYQIPVLVVMLGPLHGVSLLLFWGGGAAPVGVSR